ncbi:MAG TPA: gluconate kinase, partial [Caulobacteraceae bacterium]
VWLTAPAAVLEARVAARRGDASDATVAVLRQQLARDIGPLGWRQVDATDALKAAAEIVADSAGN